MSIIFLCLVPALKLSIAITALISAFITTLISALIKAHITELTPAIPAFPVLVVMLAILSITESFYLVPAVCFNCMGKPVKTDHIPRASVIRRSVPAAITVYKVVAINENEIIRSSYCY